METLLISLFQFALGASTVLIAQRVRSRSREKKLRRLVARLNY